MLRLILRKLFLLILLVPLLHASGFFYALRYQPVHIIYQGNLPSGFTLDNPGPDFSSTYGEYLQNLRQGDWGKTERTPLTSYVPRFINRSLILTGFALLTTLGLGPLLALLAISRRTGRVSSAALTVFTLGTALPGFFLGTLLIVVILLATRWGWFAKLPLPVQGYGFDKHLILPVLVLAARPVLYVAYVTAGLLEHEFQQDYIRVAKGKGLRWRQLLWRHALPNVAAAMITTLGRSLQLVIGGLVLVETLFDWRGIGWLMMTVVAGRADAPNYFNAPLLAMLLAIFATLLIITDLLTTLWAYLADPRLRQSAAAGRS
ncbi:MAG: ABC transporter permease [Herpetosiphonaceae bacterium]|nr:ABC transporter permease [Herpetosiphonaceae bacterium]